mgnify:CR=1 FL=1
MVPNVQHRPANFTSSQTVHAPFRVVTSDGTTYEIRHPELVIVSLASAVIGYPDPGNPAIASHYDIVSMRYIVRLEPGLQPSSSN